MVGQPKASASLSSGLLARKGQARPAMRSQGAGFSGMGLAHDDLGWNDMGDAPAPTAIETETVAPVPVAPVAPSVVAPPVVAQPVPAVLVERAELADAIELTKPVQAKQAVRAVSVATATRIGRETARQTAKGKAAFTLRLDTDRHLRLRLASAITNRSSQALVADALDRFLDTVPEVDALIAQLPTGAGR